MLSEFMGIPLDGWSGPYDEFSESESFEFVDFPSNSFSGLMGLYLWNASNRGKLFDVKTYNKYALNRFLENFLGATFKEIPFPPNFEKKRVLEIFLKKLEVAFDKSGLIDSFESVDTEDVKSVEELARKNKETGEEGYGKFIEFLKQDAFPPILWMEFVRFEQVFVDTMEFMLDRLELWFKLTPKRKSDFRKQSRLTKTMTKPYSDLLHNYFGVMVNLLRMYLFMEVWSCENESELFAEKLWKFGNIDPQAFDEIFLEFHNSINQLQQSILSQKPETIKIDFSKPTEWAFKQLVQMAEV
jgi:hypothetical protein